ncbi:hypothetical protein Harman_31140 [Haloarcula mannanilytica]|uniref:Uncharacterized protein n=1 Tax=Haloarcula mannanilytica TaxID=2509225 RepID=A0A4C2ESL6_9EURY|nr:hypothetical protein Harman_31140 [Haloarcula mannanilytica]
MSTAVSATERRLMISPPEMWADVVVSVPVAANSTVSQVEGNSLAYDLQFQWE